MQNRATTDTPSVDSVEIAVPRGVLHGDLCMPVGARGLVIFAHGSGSSRFSSRNRHVARYLSDDGFATLLLDLLTSHEEAVDLRTMEYRFDIPRLGSRVIAAIDWALHRPHLRGLPIGCFGASTGAAAALIASAERPDAVRAVVSRGGRPDLANAALARVAAPTLFIVGGEDARVIELNRDAMRRMTTSHVEIEIVPGATHLFEEPGTLEQVERLASGWFTRYSATPQPMPAASDKAASG
jgi:putative phosphoribosyl transferase